MTARITKLTSGTCPEITEALEEMTEVAKSETVIAMSICYVTTDRTDTVIAGSQRNQIELLGCMAHGQFFLNSVIADYE